ncbi:MAG: RCC1 domain-containing protein [archaeon]|nr:RCC1 domain-containing protein [archaeon]
MKGKILVITIAFAIILLYFSSGSSAASIPSDETTCNNQITLLGAHDNKLYGTGCNNHGQLGTGNTDNVLSCTNEALDNVK